MAAVKAILQAVAALSQSPPVVQQKLCVPVKDSSSQPAAQPQTMRQQQQPDVQPDGKAGHCSGMAAPKQQQLYIHRMFVMQRDFSNMAVVVQLLSHLLHACNQRHKQLHTPVEEPGTLAGQMGYTTNGGLDFPPAEQISTGTAAAEAAYKDSLYSASMCLKVMSRLVCDTAVLAFHDDPQVCPSWSVKDLEQFTYAMQFTEAAVRVISVTAKSQRPPSSNDLIRFATDCRTGAHAYATDVLNAVTAFIVDFLDVSGFVGADASWALYTAGRAAQQHNMPADGAAVVITQRYQQQDGARVGCGR